MQPNKRIIKTLKQVSRRNLFRYSGIAIASTVVTLIGKNVMGNSSQASARDKTAELSEKSKDNSVDSLENTPQTTKNEIELAEYEFDVIAVNDRGEEINRKVGKAQYFSEDLGSGITLEMTKIPGGIFMMGSPEYELGRGSDESPQREVIVQSFYMGKYEVTQAQWKQVAGLPQIERELDPDPSSFKGENFPVEKVSWFDAVEFCGRLSRATERKYRLPSEAEWEYACRAGTASPFYFGETITTKLANYDGDYIYANEKKGEYRGKTTPIGSFPPNAFGLYDMHGNVWEWCRDTYQENYEGAPKDGSAWIVESNKSAYVQRGGDWNFNPFNDRSANRDWNVPHNKTYTIGFRCCFVSETQGKRKK